MRITVFGKRRLHFTSKDGNEIDGLQLFYGFVADNVDGLQTDKIFLSSKKFGDIAITTGDDYEVTFDRNGKIETIEKA